MSDPGLHRSPLLRPFAIGFVCVLVVGALWLNFAPRPAPVTPPVQPATQAALTAPTPPPTLPAAPPAVVAAPAPAAVAAAPSPTAPPAVAAATPPPAVVKAPAPAAAAVTPPPAAPAAVASATPPAVVAKTPAPAAVAATPPPAPVAAAPAPTPVTPPPAAAPEATKPSFDIVRVNPQGDAVIAGRATPGAEVTVTDNGKAIGKTEADASGQWVILPAAPIGPGGRELTVASQAADQQPVKGDAPVLVLMPEKPKPAPELVASAQPTAPPPPASPTIVAPAAPVVVLAPANAAPRVLQGPPLAVHAGLGLGTVDYDDRGAIRFAGTAPAGATVRTYVDNQPAGDAAADADGKWTLVPQSALAAGDHELRLDQLGRDGQVTARLELPFQRADLSPQAIAEGRIVVQPGQNLWRIARHAYGRGVQYVEIYQANRDQIRDPNLIYPGQAFAIPVADRGSATMPPSSSTSR